MVTARLRTISIVSISFVVVWLLLILLFAAQLAAAEFTWVEGIEASFYHWLPWLLVSPVIIAMALRFPLSGRSWKWHLSIHVVACFAILLATHWFQVWLPKPVEKTTTTTVYPEHPEDRGERPPPFPDDPFGDPFGLPPLDPEPFRPGPDPRFRQPHRPPPSQQTEIVRMVGGVAPLGIPLYAGIVLFAGLITYRGEIHRREQKALLLESNLQTAQLDLLRSQLQPHFLFNSLNAIGALIHTSPEKADTMVVQLSDLLRSTLDQRHSETIPLSKEMEIIGNFLKIQEIRFGERMGVEYALSPESLRAKVPPMILLPLVENAVRYAVETRSARTTITLSSGVEDGQLWVSVRDTGKGLQQNTEQGTGVGLANIRKRLGASYPGGSAELTLSNHPDGGAIATLKIPYQGENA